MEGSLGGGRVGSLGGADLKGGGAEVKGGGAEVIGGGADEMGGGQDLGMSISSASALTCLCMTFASCLGARFFFRKWPAADLERGRAGDVLALGGFEMSVLAGRGGAGLGLDLCMTTSSLLV